ncbi:MAG: amidase [Chloroflexota bacterium]
MPENTDPQDLSTVIAAAEQLMGVSFTDAERTQMQAVLQEHLNRYDDLHNATFENTVGMALHFQPLPPEPVEPTAVPRSYVISTQPEVTRPDNLEDVAFWPLTQLAQLIHTKQVTSVELTEMYLERLRNYGPKLECVVTLTEDIAMEQARRADAELAANRYRGPLHGIPWGAKDLLAVRGHPTTWGAMPFKDQVIDMNATVVERLEAAGALLVAKLTMGALAYGDVWFGGVTKNPWNIETGSEGSSAGSGSATAAGLVGFSIGTETLGSIINPSTRCGVTGLRPTFGRVSRHGAMALVWSMDKIGPICRSVEDCALVFSAIYGPDGHDVTVSDKPFTWNPSQNPRKLRVGYPVQEFEAAQADSQTAEGALANHNELIAANNPNSNAVLDVLREQDFDLVPIALPEGDMSPLFLILIAEAAAAFDDLTRNNTDDTLVRQDDNAWPNLFRAARLIPAVEYIQATRLRTLVMHQLATVMTDIDVFVSPSFGNNVLPMTNHTGHPAIAVPNGFTPDGMPTSITFVGSLYGEADLLAVAKAYQDATDFHTQHPDLSAL